MNRRTGEEMAAWIDRHGLTRQGAADALGVSRSQVQRYLVGTVPPAVARTMSVYDEAPKTMASASGVRSGLESHLRTPALRFTERTRE